jgi:hypothetical protein
VSFRYNALLWLWLGLLAFAIAVRESVSIVNTAIINFEQSTA